MTNIFTSSFRDPAGRLILLQGCALRIIFPEAVTIVDTLLSSPQVFRLMQNGTIVVTSRCDAKEAKSILGRSLNSLSIPAGVSYLLHERIPFISYPSEWAPEMLHAAACFTIENMLLLLDEGIGLKDATPYNILFRGPNPVLVDFLSLEERNRHDPNWLGYAQFIRTFLAPLLANKEFGLPLGTLFLGSRDGMEPETLYRMSSPLKRLNPIFLSLVSIPTWLGRTPKINDAGIYKPTRLKDADKASFILHSLLKRLKRTLEHLQPSTERTSVWKNYTKTHSYSSTQFDAKQEYVLNALRRFAPKTVLDIGCNTGLFSQLAAKSGARVVAIDCDPIVIGELWRKTIDEKLDILPLVVNIARPTPAIGWKNTECSSFLDRAKGAFNAVFMLAVIHHLLITEGIPLSEIIDLASLLTSDLLVIELIFPDDIMFRKLARGRDNLYTWLTKDVFEQECRKRFQILDSKQYVNKNRILYVMRKVVP
jgi:SAM-dependent methyltransferase